MTQPERDKLTADDIDRAIAGGSAVRLPARDEPDEPEPAKSWWLRVVEWLHKI